MESTVQQFIEQFDALGGRLPEQRLIDLGGPEGGRYWVVTSDHLPDHPAARDAAVMARATGSVGATSNSIEFPDDHVTVRRLDRAES